MNDSEPLHYRSAAELAASIKRRELAVTELMDVSLARIETVNEQVNAIISLDAEAARDTAKIFDEQRKDIDDKPLYGLPIAIKDLVLTKGIRTTFGSPIYRDFVPDIDELIVSRLKEAGAIVIGKTNVPEFGAGSQTFNTVFGATRNPYDLSKTCGGSSGGAAVALACGMLSIADGSDLGGSLRNPASFCNVLGFRPSPGRVPSWPRSFSSDPLGVAGPMARSAEDIALLLSVMAGPDPRVPISLPEPGASFRRPLATDWQGVRLAWSPDLGRYEVDREVADVLERQLSKFEALGCTVERAEPDLAGADEIFQTLRAWLFTVKLGEDYRRHRDELKDTIAWNVEKGLALTVEDITRAEIERAALIERVAAFFERYDYLLCPAAQVPPFPVEQEWVTRINDVEMESYLDWMGVCYAITVTGCPAISVPAGFTASGLPIGFQIVGPRWQDFAVLQLAHAFETLSDAGRRRPSIAHM